ncbi:glycosyltransferase [Luteolibacter sp. AS25]|uniref:glycosyltransferase n=1 Tax=Luteolibacter sp. AS25 TaxID=3135776 RepID=UPI00398ADA82
MKILVSAFACSPYQGSEPGVGWAAICHLAIHHDPYVLLDVSNQHSWEKAESEGIIPANVRVRFLRTNKPCWQNRLMNRLQNWLWYYAYNRVLLQSAIDWHEEENFDLCHQITIGTWRVPSPLWQMPIPFVWGPIGGGSRIDRKFRSMLSSKAIVFEIIRDFNSWLTLRSGKFKRCVENTDFIITTDSDTEALIKPYREDRPMSRMLLSFYTDDRIQRFRRIDIDRPPHGPLKLFAGGNMEGRKGLSVAVKALALVKERGIRFTYIIAGGGPDIPHIKGLVQKLGISGSVFFHEGYKDESYLNILKESDIYLLPSFRESMGMTLVEAILSGCYPIVANTSAQGEIVGKVGGHAVGIDSIDSLIRGLAEAIIWCSENRNILPQISSEISANAANYVSSANYGHNINQAYENALVAHSQEPPAA